MLANIRIVLVETSHPGNIGAAARAMKNMGLQQLYLVSPVEFPHPDAIARASGADDVLQAAVCVETLDQAISDCTLVMGASARLRSLAWPQLNPRQAAIQTMAAAQGNQVAIVFGRERTGLSNDELQLCQYLVHIPCNQDFSSLNLAAAVQVIAYELFQATLNDDVSEVDQVTEQDKVLHDEMQRYYQHLEDVLIKLDFLNPDYPKKLMARLRRLFNRAQPDQREINILRGILTAIEKHHDHH